jgi:hypothetical protein
MQKGVVIDLLDEEIRHVGGTHDHPVELAPADDLFLRPCRHRSAPAADGEPRYREKPTTAATVASPEARYADQSCTE